MHGVRRLEPGDRVGVVAPSGPVPRQRFEAGAAILGARYRLIVDERIFTRTGYLAGDDDARVAELQAALDDDSLAAVFCARGGYGLSRILSRLNLRRVRKPIIGFSDTTALHGALQAAGIRSLHGPVVTQLGDLASDDATALFDVLEGAQPTFTGLRSFGAGRVEGPVIGGNLEVFSRLVGTPHLPSLRGAILLLEEVGERPYRMDRALTHLLAAGALDGLGGAVIGDLVGCVDKDGAYGPSAEEVIVERLQSLGIPIAAGMPVGHDMRNRALPLGARALLDGNTLTFVESLTTQ